MITRSEQDDYRRECRGPNTLNVTHGITALVYYSRRIGNSRRSHGTTGHLIDLDKCLSDEDDLLAVGSHLSLYALGWLPAAVLGPSMTVAVFGRVSRLEMLEL